MIIRISQMLTIFFLLKSLEVIIFNFIYLFIYFYLFIFYFWKQSLLIIERSSYPSLVFQVILMAS